MYYDGPIPGKALLRKALACLLCACLVQSSLPLAWADPPNPSPQSAAPDSRAQQMIQFFEAIGLIRDTAGGPRDPVRSYFVDSDTGRPTLVAEVAFAYYSLGRPPERLEELTQEFRRQRDDPQPRDDSADSPLAQAVRELRRRMAVTEGKLTQMRSSGQASAAKLQEAQRRYLEVRGTAAQISGTTGTMALQGQLLALFHGASQPDPLANPYVRGRALDEQGQVVNVFYRPGATGSLEEAFRTNPQGQITYSADIAAQQQMMNSSQSRAMIGRCETEPGGTAPYVHVTGRWSPEMLRWNDCNEQAQIRATREELMLHEAVEMARNLGEQLTSEQRQNLDDTYKRLQKRKIYAGFHWGHIFPFLPEPIEVWKNIVERDPLFQRRRAEIKAAEEALKRYRQVIEGFAGRDVFTQSDLKHITDHEGEVSRHITMAQLDGFTFQVMNQSAILNYGFDNPSNPTRLVQTRESAEAQQLRNAMERARSLQPGGPDPEQQGRAVAGQLLASLQLVQGVRRELERSQPGSDLVAIDSLFSVTKNFIDRVGQAFQLYLDIPMKLAEAYRQSATFFDGVKNIIAFIPNNFSKVSKLWGQDWDWLGTWRKGDLTPSITYGLAWLGNKGLKILSGGAWDVFGGYLSDRDAIDKHLGVERDWLGWSSRPSSGYSLAFERLKHGDFEGAMGALIGLRHEDPMVRVTHPLGQTGDPNESQRLQASTSRTEELLTRTMKVHLVSGLVIDLLVWSTATALMAPALGKLLGLASRMQEGVRAAKRAQQAMPWFWRSRTFFGEISLNASKRLLALSGSAVETSGLASRYFWRWRNAFAEIFKFELMVGAIGGGFGFFGHMLGYGYDHYFDGPTKNDSFLTALGKAGEKGLLGAELSAQWAVNGPVPMILFISIPYTAFWGARARGAAQYVAERGVMGYLNGGIPALLRRLGLGRGALWWRKTMTLAPQAGIRMGSFGNFLIQLDHIAKFQVLHILQSNVGYHLGYWLRSTDFFDEGHVGFGFRYLPPMWLLGMTPHAGNFYISGANERHISALIDGLGAEMLPLWMFLPQGPAQNRLSREYQTSMDAVKLFKKDGRWVELANAGEEKIKLTPEEMRQITPSLLARLFLGKMMPTNEFSVPHEVQAEAYRRVAPEEVKAITGRPLERNGLDYLAMMRLEDGEVLGVNSKLRMTQTGRRILYELAQEVIRNDPEQARQMLGVDAYDIPAFLQALQQELGVLANDMPAEMTPDLQFFVALIVRGSKLRLRDVARGKPRLFDAQTRARADEILKPYDGTRKAVKKAWKEALDAFERLTGYRSDPFNAFMKEYFGKELPEWNARVQLEQGEDYTVMLEKFDQLLAQHESGMNAREVEALRKFRHAIETQESRWHYSNTVKRFLGDTAQSLRIAGRRARSGRYSEDENLLTQTFDMLKDWIDNEWGGRPEHERVWRPSQTPQGKSDFDLKLDAKWNEIKQNVMGNLKTDQGRQLLRSTFASLRSSPWLIRNAKGKPIMGWRPGQFLRMMQFFQSILQGYESGYIIRIFLQEATGGGKSFLVTEGLWPFIEAYAKRMGKEAEFVVTSDKLKEEMLEHIRATGLEGQIPLETWGKVVGELAEAKLTGSSRRKWKLTFHDEFAQLGNDNPATSVGEAQPSITWQSTAHLELMKNQEVLEHVVAQGPRKLAQHIKLLLDSARNHAERLKGYQEYRQARQIVRHLENAHARLQAGLKDMTEAGRKDKVKEALEHVDKAAKLYETIQQDLALAKPLQSLAPFMKGHLQALRQLADQLANGQDIALVWGRLLRVLSTMKGRLTHTFGKDEPLQARNLKQNADAFLGEMGRWDHLAGERGWPETLTRALSKIESGREADILVGLQMVLNILKKPEFIEFMNRVRDEASTYYYRPRTVEIEQLRASFMDLWDVLKGPAAKDPLLKQAENLHAADEILLEGGPQEAMRLAQEQMNSLPVGQRVNLNTLTLDRISELAIERAKAMTPQELQALAHELLVQNLRSVIEHQAGSLRLLLADGLKGLASRQSLVLTDRVPLGQHNLGAIGDIIGSFRDAAGKLENAETFLPPTPRGLGYWINRLAHRNRDANQRGILELLRRANNILTQSSVQVDSLNSALLTIAQRCAELGQSSLASEIRTAVKRLGKRLSPLEPWFSAREWQVQRGLDELPTIGLHMRDAAAELRRRGQVDASEELAGLMRLLMRPRDPRALVSEIGAELKAGKGTMDKATRARLVRLQGLAQDFEVPAMSVRERLRQVDKEIRREVLTRGDGWEFRLHALTVERADLARKAVDPRSEAYIAMQEMSRWASGEDLKGEDGQVRRGGDKYGYLSFTSDPQAWDIYMERVANTSSEARHDFETKDAEVRGAFQALIQVLGLANPQLLSQAQEAEREYLEGSEKALTFLRRCENILSEALETPATPEAAELQVKYAELFKLGRQLSQLQAELESATPERQAELLDQMRILELDEIAPVRQAIDELNGRLARTAVEQAVGRAQARLQQAEQNLNLALPGGRQAAQQEVWLRQAELEMIEMLVSIEGAVRYQAIKQVREAVEPRHIEVSRELTAKGKEYNQPNLGVSQRTALRREVENLNAERDWLSRQINSLRREAVGFEQTLLVQHLDKAQARAKGQADLARQALERVKATDAQKQLPAFKDLELRLILLESPLAVSLGGKSVPLRERLHNTPDQAGNDYAKVFKAVAKEYTKRIASAIRADRFLPEAVRWTMYMQARGVLGLLFGQPSGWTVSMLRNMAQGHHNDPSPRRLDKGSRRTMAVFQGKIMPELNQETLVVDQLANNQDVTFVEHRTLATVGDIIRDLSLPLFGASGAKNRYYADYLVKTGKFTIAGEGSPPLENVGLDVQPSQAQRFRAVKRAMKLALRSGQGNEITFAAVSEIADARALVRLALREGWASPGEISKIHTDVTYLSSVRPEARVRDQINQGAANRGHTRLYVLWTPGAGIGTDINVQGDVQEGGTFPGYMRIRMILLTAHEFDVVQEIQIGGRVATGRLPKGAVRTYLYGLDIPTALENPEFTRMLLNNPTIRGLIDNPPPDLRAELQLRNKARAGWAEVHWYARTHPDYLPDYLQAVREYLYRSQGGKGREHILATQVLGEEGHHIVREPNWGPSLVPSWRFAY